MAEKHSMISVSFENREIPAYRTCQRDDQPHPALLLIHEVWGLSDHIKSVADRFCKEGYEVLAPDLMSGTALDGVLTPDMQNDLFDPEKRNSRQPEIRALMSPLGSPDFSKEVLQKLHACFDYLKNKPNVTKIGVVGFCFGGTYSFGMATQEPELAASVAFYGHGEQFMGDFNKINSPVMAFYGQKDEALNAHIPEIDQALKGVNKDFTYKIYANTGHAFFNDTNRFAYNEEAAKDAWQLTLQFFKQNLG